MSKTKHLDTAIAILKGTAGAKRAPAKGVQMAVFLIGEENTYSIQVGAKTVVERVPGDRDAALADANTRAARLRALTGKPVTIHVYD